MFRFDGIPALGVVAKFYEQQQALRDELSAAEQQRDAALAELNAATNIIATLRKALETERADGARAVADAATLRLALASYDPDDPALAAPPTTFVEGLPDDIPL